MREVPSVQGQRGTDYAGPSCRPPSKRRRRATEGGSRVSGAGGCQLFIAAAISRSRRRVLRATHTAYATMTMVTVTISSVAAA